MMASLYDIADSMIDDKTKEEWLKKYLAEPANFDKFMELMLQKTAAEGIKKKQTPNKPPRIE
jgi:hypothetical protein